MNEKSIIYAFFAGMLILVILALISAVTKYSFSIFNNIPIWTVLFILGYIIIAGGIIALIHYRLHDFTKEDIKKAVDYYNKNRSSKIIGFAVLIFISFIMMIYYFSSWDLLNFLPITIVPIIFFCFFFFASIWMAFQLYVLFVKKFL